MTHSQSKNESRISSSIALTEPGYQQGYLDIPHSVHRSAYGVIRVPIVSMKAGRGPTVLLTAGVHGDEYEGQVILAELVKRLRTEPIQGQVIALPMVNAPAGLAASRVSPVDGCNLNRCFPGDANGSPTRMLAHFIERELMPRVDYHLDLHSGGSSLEYLPCALMRSNAVQAHGERALALAEAFAAPFTMITESPTGYLDETIAGAAERNGVLCLMAELGGGGAISPDALGIGRRGVDAVLAHLAVTSGLAAAGRSPAMRFMRVDNAGYYAYADTSGVFEPLVKLGDQVSTGDPAARLHTPDRPWAEPALVTFQADGVVVCRRSIGQALAGDCLFHLAAEWPSAHAVLQAYR